jgi:tetratricopeptide (TPR) repeat protein
MNIGKFVFFGVLILFFNFIRAGAQEKDSSSFDKGNEKLDLSFIDFLINNQEHEDALLLLKNGLSKNDERFLEKDSIHYYIAWAYYNLKKLDSSLVYFEKINANSPFYLKSKFYENFEHMYLNQYEVAATKIDAIQTEDSTLQELKKFQQASCVLLQRDFIKFDDISKKFNYNNFSCAEEQKELFKRRDEMLKNKRKSPFLAGLMSAVVPGTGKFYAGYRGQAISAMIPTFIFAAAAAESYYRAGPKSAQFITAASLFGIFYVGNIWGSVLSVKTFYELRNNEIHNNIMLDLHIPLRRIFSN